MVLFVRVRSLWSSRLLAVALAVTAGMTGLARAQDETEIELAPIVIEDTSIADAPLPDRTMETSQDVTGFGETIVTDVSWQSFDSTAELLGQSVGAQLRRQGAREDYSTLSIRGAPAGQIRVLLDGVSLGRADDAVVNLADIPVDAIDRIEIYRGSAPAGLSSASAASVVNILTKDPRGGALGAASGLGSFGSGKIVGYGAGRIGEGSASALASLRTTDGDFEYFSDNKTLHNPADDCIRRRENNASDAVSGLLRYRHPVGDSMRLLAREQIFYKDEGVPPYEGCPPPGAPPVALSRTTLETIRSISALALESADKAWALESNVLYEQERLGGFETDGVDNVADTIASTTQGRWSRALGSHVVSTSGEVSYETFEQRKTDVLEKDTTADRWSLALAAGDEWTIARWNVTLSLQARHQQLWSTHEDKDGSSSGNEHSTDPRAGLRWQPLPSLAIKGNIGTYFRAPTFDELFGTDGFTEGNPELTPETGINRDAGFEWTPRVPHLERFELGYSYFHNDVEDVIVVVQTFNRTAQAENIARAHIAGHEARIEAHGLWGLGLSANYTYQEAINRTQETGAYGKQLSGLPPHEAYARLSMTLPFTSDRAVLAYDIQIDGEHVVDVNNDAVSIPTRVVHGLALIVSLAGGFRLTVEADNLGDTLIPDELGFPLPGRAFYATLSWSRSEREDKHDEG